VPMFFMRETPGSHPAKEPATDPLYHVVATLDSGLFPGWLARIVL
jgi:hypothetical protein